MVIDFRFKGAATSQWDNHLLYLTAKAVFSVSYLPKRMSEYRKTHSYESLQLRFHLVCSPSGLKHQVRTHRSLCSSIECRECVMNGNKEVKVCFRYLLLFHRSSRHPKYARMNLRFLSSSYRCFVIVGFG